MLLKDYIQGKKQGKEANRLEREAMNDPFLQEALDGFEKVAGDHAKIIQQLEKKYIRQTIVPKRRILAPLPYKRILLYWSVAVSVLILIMVSIYLLPEQNRYNYPELAENKSDKNENVILFDSPVSQPEQSGELQTEKLITAEVNKKDISRSTVAFTPPIIKEDESSSLADIVVVTEVEELSDLAEAPAQTEHLSSETLMLTDRKNQTIRGKVVDETGEPIVGASISVKDTGNGTITGVDGAFTLHLSTDDSSNLTAKYLGYEPKEIPLSDEYQVVTLKPDNSLLEEVVIVAFGSQKKSTRVGSVSSIPVSDLDIEFKRIGSDSIQHPFGEKEFRVFCQLNAEKNICGRKDATVKVSFFIDENGKPSKIEYKKYSCEDVKVEMDKVFSFSPAWSKRNRKVTMTIKW